jgi:hypothetical protein
VLCAQLRGNTTAMQVYRRGYITPLHKEEPSSKTRRPLLCASRQEFKVVSCKAWQDVAYQTVQVIVLYKYYF